jgi:hypothetical protein
MGMPIDTKYGFAYIPSIAATHSHCEGPRQTRRSFTIWNLRGSIPGNGHSAKHKLRSPCRLWNLPDSPYGRTPNHASQPANNTEHEMCDAARWGNRGAEHGAESKTTDLLMPLL